MTKLVSIWSVETVDALRIYFGLTDAEASVIRDIMNGVTANELAAARKTALNTVRTQIKSILVKTGYSSQVELIQKFGFLQQFGMLDGNQEILQDQYSSKNKNTPQRMELHNGGWLGYTVLASPIGRPVLFIHGLADGWNFPKQIISKLYDLDIALIAPSRPCFGNSDPYETFKNPTEQLAGHLVELLDVLKIDNLPVQWHIAGSLYAYVLAQMFPDRVKSILPVAGAVPMIHDWQYSKMSLGHRVSGLTARRAPRVLPLLNRSGIRLIEGGRHDVMLNLALKDATVDLCFVRQPEIRKILIDRFEFVIRQRHLVFNTDIVDVSADWSEKFENFSHKVAMVHGTHDCVVLIDGARELSSNLQDATLVEVETAGNLLFLQEPDIVFAELVKLLE